MTTEQVAAAETSTVVLLEDDIDMAALVQALLGNAAGSILEVTHVTTLGALTDSLNSKPADLAIIDLNVPDSRGLKTLLEVLRHEAALPVIVLTANDEDDLAMAALRAGAREFLAKNRLSEENLLRSVRFALESTGARSPDAAIIERVRTREEALFERLRVGTSSVTSRLMGQQSLQEVLPDIFAEHSDRFGLLIEMSLDERIYEVDHAISTRVRDMSQSLSQLLATARDLVEVYDAALRSLEQRVSVARQDACKSAGQLLLLELMGKVLTNYRAQVPKYQRPEGEHQ